MVDNNKDGKVQYTDLGQIHVCDYLMLKTKVISVSAVKASYCVHNNTLCMNYVV